jgi:hypothetical protein
VSVLLRVDPHALHQCNPQTKQILASYYYKDIGALYDVQDYPGGFVVRDSLFGRLHLFAAESKTEIMQKMLEFAHAHVGVQIEKPKPYTLDRFVENKFGQFR